MAMLPLWIGPVAARVSKSPIAKLWKALIIAIYLSVGILFYHVGATVQKPCDLQTVTERCPDADLECILGCFERWTVIDSLYFSMVTMSTVGYGDLSPGTGWGDRIFTMIFIIVGIVGPFILLSAMLGSLFNHWEQQSRAIFFSSNTVGVDLDGDGDVDIEEPPTALRYYMEGFLFWIIFLVGWLLFSSGIYVLCDGSLTFGDAFYHCYVTATTVGYGDIPISTQAARLWSCVHIAVSVGALGALISKFQELTAKRAQTFARISLLQRQLDKDLICSLDKDGSGVDKARASYRPASRCSAGRRH